MFAPGDEVFGAVAGLGSLAEYVTLPQDGVLLPKPANQTFEQAASVPLAAFTALQALRDQGHVQPGHKVLVNGASGGVGTFAVQIARALGAEVTGVCSIGSMEIVASIGASEVIDYTKADFTRTGKRYDLLIDIAGNLSQRVQARAHAPRDPGGRGRPEQGPVARAMIRPPRRSRFPSRQSDADVLPVPLKERGPGRPARPSARREDHAGYRPDVSPQQCPGSGPLP